jgi:hypothetical protein
MALNRSLEQAHGQLHRQRLDGHRHHLHTTSPMFADDNKVAKSRKKHEPEPTKIGRMVYTVEVLPRTPAAPLPASAGSFPHAAGCCCVR